MEVHMFYNNIGAVIEEAEGNQGYGEEVLEALEARKQVIEDIASGIENEVSDLTGYLESLRGLEDSIGRLEDLISDATNEGIEV
jgi:archaellum component FlaC